MRSFLRSERFPTLVLFLFMTVLTISLNGCGGGGGGGGAFLPSSGSPGDATTLNGAWMFVSTDSNMYITADGAGTVVDVGEKGNTNTPGTQGAYLVTNNTFSMTFYGSPSVQTNGTLVTASTASVTVIVGKDVFPGTSMIKVQDPGACQGTWTGTFTVTSGPTSTSTIDLTVDASGTITNGTIAYSKALIANANEKVAPFVITSGRKLFCESMSVAGLIQTSATDQIQVTGRGNGAAIVGTYTAKSGLTGRIKLVNTSRTGQADNAKISGPWLLSAEAAGTYYLVSDGTGSITDMAGLKPGGAYRAYADNTFTMLFGNPVVFTTGRLTSATTGSLVGEDGGTGSLIKVADISACQGNWAGTLSDLKSGSTNAIDLTVNASGIITGGTLTAGSGTYTITSADTKLYCQSGLAAGSLMTNGTPTFSYIQIMGSGNGAAIVGNYSTDPSNGITGIIDLMKTGSPPVDNRKFTGPWLMPYFSGALYLHADGNGKINELSVPGFGDPAGAYSAYTDNSLILTIIAGSTPVAYMTGGLASDQNTASMTITEVEIASVHPISLIKVADPGACKGTWIGTLTETYSGPTYTISLTVGDDGLITGGTLTTDAGYPIQTSGHLYCQSGFAAGLLTTGAAGPYNQVQIIGNGNVTAITGSYALSGSKSGAQAGSIALVNTTHDASKNNALLTNMSWLLFGDTYKTIYIRTDGSGTALIEDVLTGSYSAYPDNTIVITFQPDPDASVFITGQLTSNKAMASLVSTGTGSTTLNTGTLLKVSNAGACQGHWTGTLTDGFMTTDLDFIVDGSGAITGGSISNIGLSPITPNVTKLYCESGQAAGLLLGDTNGYLLTGSLYGTTISGSFILDNHSVPDGSMILTKH